MNYWLFQSNPKYYRILDAIGDLEQMPWFVTRYGKEMAIGDSVLIWVSGQAAGIYGFAEIVELPQIIEKPPDIKYWIDKSRVGTTPQAFIRFTTKLLEKPLLRNALKQDSLLQHLSVIRQPNATNYKVTAEQWQRVHELKA